MSRDLDKCFEKYRAKTFGAYAYYPVDAYTHFAVGWKAAMEHSADIAKAIDSGRGNEDESAKAIRRM